MRTKANREPCDTSNEAVSQHVSFLGLNSPRVSLKALNLSCLSFWGKQEGLSHLHSTACFCICKNVAFLALHFVVKLE